MHPRLLLVAALLATPSAVARPLTYCVGGYTGTPPRARAACGQPNIRRQHRAWHEHFWVTNGRECMICFDEMDNSCETDFTDKDPLWHATSAYKCRSRRAWGDGLSIYANVVNGENLSPSRPPPTPPEVLDTLVAVETPGPYVAGDTLLLRGQVQASDGVRGVGGGTFELYAGDTLVGRVPGTPDADGVVHASVTLPASDDVRVRFVPTNPDLNPGDTLRAASSDPLSLSVQVCGFRARVLSPLDHEALASGQSVGLRAALFTPDGVPASPPGAQLRYTVSVHGAPPVILDADASGVARWTPPSSPSPTTVQIYATGHVGGHVVCHAGPVTAQFSDVGLGLDTSGLPDICYVGLPCAGTATLVRPEPGAARQRVDQLLADPTTEVLLIEAGQERARSAPHADDRYALSQVFTVPRAAQWTLEVRSPAGVVPLPPHPLRVRPPLVVRLPAVLDLGTIPAGSRTRDHCTDLDFSASEAAEEHRWRLVLEGAETCRGRPVVAARSSTGAVRTVSLDAPLTIEALDPDHPALTVCLDAPRCAGEVSPGDVRLRVIPLTPAFTDQATVVAVRWTVTGRPWWRCQLWWMGPSAAGGALIWLVLGFLRPARFPADAAIRVAGREQDLKRAVSVPLRDCPGSGAGFYRDARLGLHHDGDVNGRVRNAALLLRATRHGGVVLVGAAPLEVRERRGGWRAVEDLATGHLPGPALYRVGESLYFKVDA